MHIIFFSAYFLNIIHILDYVLLHGSASFYSHFYMLEIHLPFFLIISFLEKTDSPLYHSLMRAIVFKSHVRLYLSMY